MRFFTATVGNNRRVSFCEQRVSPILEVVTSTTHLLKSKHSDQILKPIRNNKRCRSLLHCAERIWKQSYIFLRLGLQSTLIRSENEAFQKRSSNQREFDKAGFLLLYGRATELFENDDITIITWFPCPSFPQTQIQTDRLLLRFQIPPA